MAEIVIPTVFPLSSPQLLAGIQAEAGDRSLCHPHPLSPSVIPDICNRESRVFVVPPFTSYKTLSPGGRGQGEGQWEGEPEEVVWYIKTISERVET